MTVQTIDDLCDNATLLKKVCALDTGKQDNLPAYTQYGLVLTTSATGLVWTESNGKFTTTDLEI